MVPYIHFSGQISRFLILVCFFSLMCASSGWATTESAMELIDDSSGVSWMRMISSLLAVLALIAGGVFLLKKLTPYKGMTSNTERSISILSRASLGQRRSICLVKIADEILVLGLTNTNISVLSRLDADEYYSRNEKDLSETASGQKQSFRRVLEKMGIGSHQTSAAREEGL